MGEIITITIVTVCYNARKCIEETIQSVVEQTYPNIEYIIIDGASGDGTLEIIQKAAEHADIKYISEPDHGIYDAMNKGIDLASGDYIQFLNAGDILLDRDVVAKVVKRIEEEDGDIFFGNIVYKYSNGHEETRRYGWACGTKWYYYTGDCINHQAVFAKRECLKNDKFDLSYRICADREWMMRMTKLGKKFVCMSFNICYYSLDENSASIRQKEVSDIEARECVKKYFTSGYVIYMLFDLLRNNRILSKVLHSVYKFIYIRKF